MKKLTPYEISLLISLINEEILRLEKGYENSYYAMALIEQVKDLSEIIKKITPPSRTGN